MKRFLCLWLPHWPIQRWIAAKPELEGQVVVLLTTDGRRVRRIADCSPAARHYGLRPQMPLAEAAALLRRLPTSSKQHVAGAFSPSTVHPNTEKYKHAAQAAAGTWHGRDIDPDGDRQALARLAEFSEQFSPQVGLATISGGDSATKQHSAKQHSTKHDAENENPDCLYWDVTGVCRWFGGEEGLIHRALEAFAERGLQARIGLADTLGAAWAVAHYAAQPDDSCAADPLRFQRGWQRAEAGAVWQHLAPLPVAALRLPPATLECLYQLGVLRVEQLAALPRRGTVARLGAEPFLRLDQALGTAQETLLVHRPPPDDFAQQWLEHPTACRETVQHILRALMQQVAAQLMRRQRGALQLDCRLDSTDGRPLWLRLGLFQPTACVEHWLELARMQFEQAVLPGALHRLSVQAVRTAPLVQRQEALAFCVQQPRADPQQLAELVNRLSSRLGPQAVVRSQTTHDPQPEQAYQDLPLTGQTAVTNHPPQTTARGRRATQSSPAAASADDAAPATRQSLQRPLLLFHPPRPLQVVAVAPDGPPIRCRWGSLVLDVSGWWGPERIETGWWRGPTIRRDYYRIETAHGTRFWLFRRLQDGQWFLQGEF